MKGFAVILMMFSLVSGVCGAPRAALAQDNGTVVAHEVYGTVTFVDPQAQKLIVASASEEEQKETVLVVGDSSMIEKDGQAATLVDISTGDDVKVSYEVDDNGQNIAASISASSQQ
jgi:hypothetical protein